MEVSDFETPKLASKSRPGIFLYIYMQCFSGYASRFIQNQVRDIINDDAKMAPIEESVKNRLESTRQEVRKYAEKCTTEAAANTMGGFILHTVELLVFTCFFNFRGPPPPQP